jgi:hypothetical protein
MFRPTFERLENRKVLAGSLGISPATELLPEVDPLPMETVSFNLASPGTAARGTQVAGIAAGDFNSDHADFIQALILPYIEQDNVYKVVNSARGDRAFITQLSQDLLGRSNDTSLDAALNQLGLASDGRFGDLNRPQGIIAILIG